MPPSQLAHLAGLAQQKAELEASRLAAAKAAEAADVGGHRAWIFSGEQPKITGIGGCSSMFITLTLGF